MTYFQVWIIAFEVMASLFNESIFEQQGCVV
jgi:hypothetical protein